MKGVILSVAAAIAITASLAYQEYACPAGSIGACCEAYDYVEKQCYRGERDLIFFYYTSSLFPRP